MPLGDVAALMITGQEIAVIIVGVHQEDGAPLVQVRLADDRPCLVACAI